ncbi:MAG: prolyl oligopeptidase family serine peptidase [Solobacterium sp.]|nr:prolyl oligopeptidase family serine peptidase [Solobacterium sp.]
MEKRLYIHGENHDIPIVLSYPDDDLHQHPAVLLLHGFMAWKEGDGYMFGIAADQLAKNGYVSARLDFCSMGENRYSRRNYGMKVLLKEAECAFEYLRNDPAVDPERIGIMGHSLGGRVTFLSSKLPSKCLISLNGAINVDSDLPMQYDHEFMDKNGYVLVETSDGRTELLFQKFYDDLKECVSSDIYSYKNPILVCVGKNDPTLDPNVSYNFVKNCGMDNVELLEIDEANHTFNAKTGDYTKLNELYEAVLVWLEKNLK